MAVVTFSTVVNAAGAVRPVSRPASVASATTSANDEALAAYELLFPASIASVEAALATLQADGASPTEAHVDALQTEWDALAANYGFLVTGLDAVLVATAAAATTGAATVGLSVTVDAAVITKISKLREAFEQIVQTAMGNPNFTP